MKVIKTFFEKKQYNDINLIKSYIKDLCGNEYSVIGGEAIDGRSKISIIHNKCGNIWSPEIRSFIYGGRRCPLCFGTKKQSINDLINRCKKLHGEDYIIIDFEEYKNNKSKVKVKHKICGHEYLVTVQNLLNIGSKCPKCSGKLKLTEDELLRRFKLIYDDDYLPNVENINGKLKIKIHHKICGNEWSASTSNILYNNTGCPFCKMTHGERIIKKYLDTHNIKYKTEYRFKDCRFTRPLPFDFYLPDYNICIEYDGIQHFKPINFFGGNLALSRNQKSDSIKSDFCKIKGINLIRITYNDKIKINYILDEIFK